MPKRTRKQSQDINEFAADVVRRSTGIEQEEPSQAAISQVMRAMGRKGGLKGAATLNARLTPAQRKASARKAAEARWGTNDDRLVSIREFVGDWAASHERAGKCTAHRAHTIDGKIIVQVAGEAEWLELPGGDNVATRAERKQIADWLHARPYVR